MPIKILLAVPTLSRADRLETMLKTVAASVRLPDRILIVDNGHQQLRVPTSLVPRTDIYLPHRNLGVAGSVNFALRNTPDDWYWLHCNDDVELDPRCIGLMASRVAGSDHWHDFCLPEHGVGSAFTVFLMHSCLRDYVGYFDEVFFPAYHEDNSYGRRMNIAGVKRIVAEGAAYVHHTSSTLQSYNEDQRIAHHENFRRNALEYVRMWGGPPEQETYQVPYDGKYGHAIANIEKWAIHVAPKEEDAR